MLKQSFIVFKILYIISTKPLTFFFKLREYRQYQRTFKKMQSVLNWTKN